MVLRQVMGAAAAALFVVSGVSEGRADFRVCNKSADKANVAIGYNSKEYGWTSEGWWSVAPNESPERTRRHCSSSSVARTSKSFAVP